MKIALGYIFLRNKSTFLSTDKGRLQTRMSVYLLVIVNR